MCEGREEDPELGRGKDKLEILTLQEMKMVHLGCLMLNKYARLNFRFCHICVQKCPSHGRSFCSEASQHRQDWRKGRSSSAERGNLLCALRGKG